MKHRVLIIIVLFCLIVCFTGVTYSLFTSESFGIFVLIENRIYMNRIILTGNGFDLAHNLPTSYTHFIDWYWNDWKKKLKTGKKIIENPLLYIDNKTDYTVWEMLLRSSEYIDSFSGHEFGEKILKSKTN